jgi:hypothetical protein
MNPFNGRFSAIPDGFSAASMQELDDVEGGVGVGTYFGDVSKLIALQKNGANVSAPQLGGPNSYYPSGGQLNRGDGYGNPFGTYS